MKDYNTYQNLPLWISNYLYQILYNIRLDYSDRKKLKAEKKLAIILCKELYEITNKDNKVKNLLHCIKNYKVGHDGRYFRYDFPEGYEGLREYIDELSQINNWR